MTIDTTASGSESLLPLAVLDALQDFVDRVEEADDDSDDRHVHSEHPLVAMIETVIEPLSSIAFGRQIVGLTRSSQKKLTIERRALEGTTGTEELQRFLFAFDEICEIVITASYYSSLNSDDEHRFFEDLVPMWLTAMHEWCESTGRTALAEVVAAALGAYREVADDVVRG